MNQKSGFKQIDYIQLEGSFKLKRVFAARSHIPLESDDLVGFVTNSKTEAIPTKIDFNADSSFSNQVMSFQRVKTYIELTKMQAGDDSL